MRRVVVSCAALLAAATPHRAAAQVEIAPAIGMYMPVGTLFKGDIQNGGESRSQVPAGMVGFRISAWPSRRLSFEGGIAFSPSQVAVSNSSGTHDITGSVVLAHARAVLQLGPPAKAQLWGFHVAAGVGMTHRSGSAWETTLGGTAPALALAFGARTRFRRSPLTMRLELEDYVLFNQFDQGLPDTKGAAMHHDLAWSVGISVPIF